MGVGGSILMPQMGPALFSAMAVSIQVKEEIDHDRSIPQQREKK